MLEKDCNRNLNHLNSGSFFCFSSFNAGGGLSFRPFGFNENPEVFFMKTKLFRFPKWIVLMGLFGALPATAAMVFDEHFDDAPPYANGAALPTGYNVIHYGKWDSEASGGGVTTGTSPAYSPTRSLALAVDPGGSYAMASGTFGEDHTGPTLVSTPLVVRMKFRLTHVNGTDTTCTTVGITDSGDAEKLQVRLGSGGKAKVYFPGHGVEEIGAVAANTWYHLEVLVPQTLAPGDPERPCTVSLFANSGSVRGALIGSIHNPGGGGELPHAGLKLVNRLPGAKAYLDDVTADSVAETSLRPGPYKITNLGSPFNDATLAGQAVMFRDAANETHLMLHYVSAQWKQPMDILHLNLTTGVARRVPAILGRPGPHTPLYYDGKYYVASSDPGYFFQYDLATGSGRQIAKLGQLHSQTSRVGDDGCIYIGEVYGGGSLPAGSGGGVERYNPATDEWVNFGSMDPSHLGQQYAYTLGADLRYIYVGLGQIPWYLAIYDRQTGALSHYWKAEGDRAGTVRRALAGGWYYERINAAGIRSWYLLENGVPTEVPYSSVPPLQHWAERQEGMSTDQSLFPSLFGYEIDLEDAYVHSYNSATATVRWKAVSDTVWSSTSVSGMTIGPSIIKRLVSLGPDEMLGITDLYGPQFLYDTDNHTSSLMGWSHRSIYDILLTPDDAYYSGYTAAFLRHDPSAPWTVSASNPVSSTTNPQAIGFPSGVAGKYNFYMAQAADEKVYVGIHHERNSTGGALGWYDPTLGTTDGLRTPFVNDDVADLLAVAGGSKILYSSNALAPNTVGRIFVFDVATQTITHTWNCPTGAASAGKLVEVAPGEIVGVTGDRIYRMNYTTGALIYDEPLGGTAFGTVRGYDRRIVIGPDGYLWLFVGNTLCRVDLATAAKETVLTTPSSSFIFQGERLYLFGVEATVKTVGGFFW